MKCSKETTATATATATATTTTKTKTISVVIVESHQHALEHYHSAIRKLKIFDKPWSMIHFDAHPDLACPQCPAVACFSPRKEMANGNLYELLDLSETGIAEWIIPLVVAAELKTIHWVKPAFSSQFPLGRHMYKVGAYCDNDHDSTTPPQSPVLSSFLDLPETAIIKTDFHTSYYHDDDAVVPSSDLLLAQQLELIVTELPSKTKKTTLAAGCDHTTTTTSSSSSSSKHKRNKRWALDICLDYFACQNPFLSDIDKVHPAATKALVSLMRDATAAIGRTTTTAAAAATTTTTTTATTTTTIRTSADLKQIIAAVLQDETNTTPMDQLTTFVGDSSETANVQQLLLLQQLQKNLTTLRQYTDHDLSLRSLVLKAIPNWDMPHDASSADEEKIIEAIRHMEEALKDDSFYNYDDSPPFLITICRSSDDEFTPPWLVEFIQQQVLALLDRIFCSSSPTTGRSSHSLSIVKDYGEWEGSTI